MAKFYASVYTLFFDGSAFILSGKGGEYGTATAAQVLSGYTIGTESGIVSGSMTNRGAVTQTIGKLPEVNESNLLALDALANTFELTLSLQETVMLLQNEIETLRNGTVA